MQLLTGKIKQAQRLVIYGPEGIGKTTLASQFPKPVFIDTEGGTAHMAEVTRFPKPKTWQDVVDAISRLNREDHEFETVIVDTIDWAEELLVEHVCKAHGKSGVEDFGYGKGYTYLKEEFRQFLRALDSLRDKGLHVVLVAHAQIKKFEEPDAAGAYDRYELKLSKQCAPLMKEWSDALLFVNYYTKLIEKEGKTKAVGGKERRLYTSRSAGYDAKNRHGLAEVLPMTYEAIASICGEIAPKPTAKPDPKPETKAEPPDGATRNQQIENVKQLWAKLQGTQEQLTKLFVWLGVDTMVGEERWEELDEKQLGRAIASITKKLQ